MKRIDIEKAFVVNLDDKIHRWQHFQKLDINIERISAVDSRENWFIYEDYGLDLVPYGRNNDHYFTQSKGAVGCYLSHYTIWKKIVDEDLGWCVVLEDDANIKSVKELIKTTFIIKNNTDIVQLNDRTQHGDLVHWFNGTTAYIINKRAARILVGATHDFSYFKENPSDVLQWRVDQLNLHDCEYLRDEVPLRYGWEVPNAIRVPADKLIGYCGHPSITEDLRLELEFQPCVELHNNLIESDVTNPTDILYWEMTCDQLGELESRDEFEWWTKKDKFQKKPKITYRCKDWCHSHTTSWKTKCRWKTNTCSGCEPCVGCKEQFGVRRLRNFSKLPDDESINLVCVLRNEVLLLPYFIEHYIRLGVTHFTFIDNDSDDGSLEFLLDYDVIECQVYHTKDSYAMNEYGVEWVNQILNEQLKDKWCVVVDVDELLIPNHYLSLEQLRNNMIESDTNIMVTCLLDFYPKDFSIKEYKPGQSFLKHSNFYDKMTKDTVFTEIQDDASMVIKGGVRHRLESNETATNDSHCLTKKSFFKYDYYDSHKLTLGMHWIMPNGYIDWMHPDNDRMWADSNHKLKFYDEICVLGHFKYLKPNVFDHFKDRITRDEDWGGSVEYKKYLEYEHDLFFDSSTSLKFDNIAEVYQKTLKNL